MTCRTNVVILVGHKHIGETMTNIKKRMIAISKAHSNKQSIFVLMPYVDRSGGYGIQEIEVFDMKQLEIVLGY